MKNSYSSISITAVLAAGFLLCLISCSEKGKPDYITIDPVDYERYWPKGEVSQIHLANGMSVYKDSKGIYFIGDMLFSQEQVDIMNGKISGTVVKKWPKKIRYCFDDTDLNGPLAVCVKSVLDDIAATGGFEFEEIPEQDPPMSVL